MADGKLTKFQDVYEFNSADEITISSRTLGDDGPVDCLHDRHGEA